MGVPVTAEGIDGLRADARLRRDRHRLRRHVSGVAPAAMTPILRSHGKQIVDLTPAAIGPYVVPAVNLDQLAEAPNLNMVTCGGQATIPTVAADQPRHTRDVCRNRRQHRQPLGRSGNPRKHRRVHADDRARASSGSAARGAARRSSFSIRPSRRSSCAIPSSASSKTAIRRPSRHRSSRWRPTSAPTSRDSV